MKDREYVKKTPINVPVDRLFAWHARNGAINRLTPPWAPLELISRKGQGIDKGVQVTFRMKVFGIPRIWEAEHFDFQENRLFRDRQTRGPFAKWEHHHLFHSTGPATCLMEDRVVYRLPLSPLSLPFAGHAQKELERIFRYRHDVLKYDMAHWVGKVRKQRILISGASGTIGKALVPFLRTCGHDVIRLVRDPEDTAEDALYWDPYANDLDMAAAGPVDAVISLNGVDISRGKWTEAQKKKIIDSRVIPTRGARGEDAGHAQSSVGFYLLFGHRAIRGRRGPDTHRRRSHGGVFYFHGLQPMGSRLSRGGPGGNPDGPASHRRGPDPGRGRA